MLSFRYYFQHKVTKEVVTYIWTIEDIEDNLLNRFIEKNSNWQFFAREQSTGAKDKNEKTIYSDDILRITFTVEVETVAFHCGSPYDIPIRYESYDCEIYFKDGSFKVYLPDIGEILAFDNTLSNLIEDPYIEGIEIIGNKIMQE